MAVAVAAFSLHPCLGWVPVGAREMPDRGVALLDVRDGNIPAAMWELHAGLGAGSNGHCGAGW